MSSTSLAPLLKLAGSTPSSFRLKRTLTVLLLTAAFATLAGCYGLSGSSSTPASPTTAPTPAPTTAPGSNAVRITTASLASATAGMTYNDTLSAQGGRPPYEWSVAGGSLPAGIQLDSSIGSISGTTESQGRFTIAFGVRDSEGNTAARSLALSVNAVPACGPPTYGCARTDTDVIPLPVDLPNWGGLIGANIIFNDPSFNEHHPPRYARVTDATTSSLCGVTYARQYAGYGVTDGSGDERVFNANDTLFWFKDAGNNPCIFGLNATTMQTGFVYRGQGNLSPRVEFSQVNPAYLYDLDGAGGGLYFANLIDSTSNTCHIGGPTCSPTFSQVYNFVDNCGVAPRYSYYILDLGGSDTTFLAHFSSGGQDHGHQVVALKWTGTLSTSTCYFYNTQVGTVRSYTGAQTPVTGTVTCNGTTVNWASGTLFDFTTGGVGWAGVNITINGVRYVIKSVHSSSAMTVNANCPAGGEFSIEPGVLLGRVNTADLYSVHNVKIDPTGTWAIVVEGGNCYSASCHVIHAWEIGTTMVKNCIYEAGGTDAGSCGDHFTESASGLFNTDTMPGLGNSPSMLHRNWANFSATANTCSAVACNISELSTTSAALFSPVDFHPSNKNDPLGTHAYPILSSVYAPESLGTITAPYSNEIIGWRQTPGAPLRFGHTFNSSLEPGAIQFSATYAIGAASSTGQFYIFTTDGEGTLGSSGGDTSCSISDGTCRSDIFILSLSPR